MTSPLTQVLVGPLRSQERRTALLARLEQVPAHLRTVLHDCYLQPRPLEEVAARCRVTVAEMVWVRADALAALGRAEGPALTGRAPVRSPYRAV